MISSTGERTIAHLLPWPAIGGTEQATLRIAQATRDKGFRSVAFFPEGAEEVQSLFGDAGIPTEAFRPIVPSGRHPAAFLSNSRSLARKLREYDVSLLHCADVMGAFYGGVAGRLAGVPVLCHVRNAFDALTLRERAMLAPAHRFAFVSHDTWKRFSLKVKPSRGHVLYDGVPPRPIPDRTMREQVRRELCLPSDTLVVGMVARISPQKDFITLARAARQVIQHVPSAKFVIVGDFEADPAHREHFLVVRAELARLGLLDSFVFTGFRSDVGRVLQAFDVFTLSTHFEGLPLVVLEAMSAGLPVVATAVNGIPEVITDESVGLLYPHRDHASLAQHLISLLANETLRQRVGMAGRNWVSSAFGQEAFSTNVSAIYQDLLAPQALPRPRSGDLRGGTLTGATEHSPAPGMKWGTA